MEGQRKVPETPPRAVMVKPVAPPEKNPVEEIPPELTQGPLTFIRVDPETGIPWMEESKGQLVNVEPLKDRYLRGGDTIKSRVARLQLYKPVGPGKIIPSETWTRIGDISLRVSGEFWIPADQGTFSFLPREQRYQDMRREWKQRCRERRDMFRGRSPAPDRITEESREAVRYGCLAVLVGGGWLWGRGRERGKE